MGCLLSEKQIPQIAVNIWNRRKIMEPLEPTQAPWAQGVGRSNRPAPTKSPVDFNEVDGRHGKPQIPGFDSVQRIVVDVILDV